MRVTLGLSILAAAAILLAGAVPAPRNCSCLPLPPVSKAVDEASAVFAGEVLAAKPLPGHPQIIEVVVTVAKCWKGDLSTEVVLWTYDTEAACGVEFDVGVDYLVFALDGAPFSKFMTHLCTYTRPLANAHEVLAKLGEPGCATPVESETWGAIKRSYN